ncbi:hypothetical protein I3842_01G004800 [Carya illinoinensis]|uniref:Condensin-2 complex subunit G2 n=1 Tax=Carya illinoinensis TaxID=32201 RepID=A0A922FY93_CARIL|nr:hypothetical protein I3842_01G004800 [Carya illinoinensis]
MEKRLRTALQSSAQDFVSSATKLSLKSVKPTIKTLIHSIHPNSDLSSSLPLSLLHSISQFIQSFQNFRRNPNPPNPNPPKSPRSPPTKRLRRSSRHSKTQVESRSHGHGSDLWNEMQKLLQGLEILAHIAVLCISHPKKAFLASDLFPVACALHDNLILFESEEGSVLLSEIASLCELWWKENLPGREALISQSLPFLLSKSLTLKRKVDVHRVYSLRDAFNLFDFEDESIEDLKLLLVRCVIAPLYLKTDDGRRFVAFTFGLSNQLLKEVLAMIRSQIPFGRKSMLEAYGEILFRAWKSAEPDLKDEIENGFLQGLIEGAIHGSSEEFSASIRRVLGGFISQRTTEGVEKLLFRLAEPVIFRSLQVANSNVRKNALHLLLDMFPLEDPDSTKEVKDTLLYKQFFLLERLLMDDCPDVRVVAVEGSCRILHLYWEIIPSASITKIITKIFDDMSHDICAEVRLSTLNGIIYLLDNPQSHEILRVLLPRLGHLMLDNVISIRVSVADLLLLLRDMRNFQFNKKITKLLMPSYFPSKVPVGEACTRCVTLIKRSPMAGARFCEYFVSEGASLKSLMELIRVFISLVLSPDKLSADQIEGLLVAAVYLCNSLATEPCYKNALKELLAGEKVKYLFAAASTARAQSSVLNIVSTISPNDAVGLFEECTDLVTNCSGISDNVERQAEVRSAHRLFLSCDGLDDMFDALTLCLQKAAYRCHIKFGTEAPKNCVSSAKRNKSKWFGKISAKWKNVNGKHQLNFEEDYSIAVGIAWQIRDLLISEDSRKAILGAQMLETSFFALKIISEVSIVQCMLFEYMDVSPILAYTALALHMTLQNVTIHSTKLRGTKKNNSTDSLRSFQEPTVLEHAVEHVLNCVEKLLGALDSGKHGKTPLEFEQATHKAASRGQQRREPQTYSSSPSASESVKTEQKRLSITVKMLTAILKFMVDITSMGLLSHCYVQFLKFTSRYVQYIISSLQRQSHDQFQFKEEDLKNIILCLKSSFTYAAKLVNLVHRDISKTSPLPPEAFELGNDLLDLISSIELYQGSGNAARIVAAAKPWLPDLILALGSGDILKKTRGEGTHFHASDRIKLHFPSWLLILAKIELSELNEVSPEKDDDQVPDSDEFPVSKKLLRMFVTLLKGNPNILDSVGVILLTGSLVGLKRKDFGLVLGLLHFVCTKLFRLDDREWGDIMLASLQDLYPQIEREIEQQNNEDGRQKLQSSKELLEPVWMHNMYETGKVSMMEE